MSVEQKISVLIVDDNEDLLDEVMFQCEHYGFDVIGAKDAQQMNAALEQKTFDVLILDIGLPDEDGWSIATRLKSSHPKMGIIVLTALSEDRDRFKSLSNGADYYFSKPVNYVDLITQIRALTRRIRLITQDSPLEVEPAKWQLDAHSKKLIVSASASVAISHTECLMLSELKKSYDSGQPVSREAIIEAIGEQPEGFDHRRLETAISRLRSKIAAVTEEKVIQSVRNRGYSLLIPLTEV